jgi:hypothetical protein
MISDEHFEKLLELADRAYEDGMIEERLLSFFYHKMAELRRVDRMKRFLKVGEYEENK